MSNAEKLSYRILRKRPVPNDITPSEFLTWLNTDGWTTRQGKGSHLRIEKIFPDGFKWSYTVKIGGEKQIKPCYIRDIRNVVEEHEK